MISLYKNDADLKHMERVVEGKNEKDFKIVPHGRYGHFIIKWADNRGVIPKDLAGGYTSFAFAEKAIKRYVEHKQSSNAIQKNYEKRKREEEAYQKREAERNGSVQIDNGSEGSDEDTIGDVEPKEEKEKGFLEKITGK